jgi:hypothetical protein
MRKKIASRYRTIGCGLLSVLLLPVAAHGGVGDILSLLATIRSTLTNVIGQTLGDIQAIESRVTALEQQAVWPLQQIADTRASIQQVRSQLSSVSRDFHAVAVSSATLAAPARLEGRLRSPLSGGLRQFDSTYTQVYLPLPAAERATAAQRNLIDVDDAFVLEALKKAAVSDQAGEDSLALADRLEEQAALAAPGSAGILAVDAEIGQLQNQAMLQKVLAAQLREEAALLAHRNALRKQAADSMKPLRNNLLHVLGRE